MRLLARHAGRAVLLLATIALAACSRRPTPDQPASGGVRASVATCETTPAVAGASSVNADPREVYLEDWVVLNVCQLPALLGEAEAQQQPITLFVNGIDTGNPVMAIDTDSGTATFQLDRTADNKGVWQPLLHDPLFDGTTTIHVSLGIKGGRAVPRAAGANTSLQLTKIYFDWTTGVWLAVLVGIAALLLYFAGRTTMLRRGPDVGDVRQPFSLGRVQMAWWFFLIVVGYVFILIVTGDSETITPSLLGLMGISAATALASVVKSTPGTEKLAARRKTVEKASALDQQIKELASRIEAAAKLEAATREQGEMEALEEQRDNLMAERARVRLPTLWSDLVTDEKDAVSLDRFQIVAWTLILGLMFLSSVIWDLTMPEFSATVLALMGISSGTYIGFKPPASR